MVRVGGRGQAKAEAAAFKAQGGAVLEYELEQNQA